MARGRGGIESILHALAKDGRLVLLRGIATILFGFLAFGWPELTLVTLILLYGAYALVYGVIAIIAAITGRAPVADGGWQ